MPFILVAFALFYLPSTFALLISQCFPAPRSFVSYSYSISTSNPIINFNFSLVPAFSAALAILQTTNVVPSLNREDWVHLNSKAATNFDYQGLVTGRAQNGWLANPGVGTLLYIYLINFEQAALPCFNLRVEESMIVRAQCSTPDFYSSTKYCASCPVDMCGVYCSIKAIRIKQGISRTLSLSALSYTALQISDNIEAGIAITSMAGGVKLYFQESTQLDELAGMVNYAGSGKEGSYIFESGLTYIRDFSRNNLSAVGIFNLNSYPVTLSVGFLDESKANIMIILIVLVGTLLLVGVIVAVVMIMRRINRTQRTIHSEAMPRLGQYSQYPKLTSSEIGFYFPSVPRSLILSSAARQSKQQENKEQENKDANNEYECIICLCGIEPQEEIKVAYCRHFFHAKCLAEWFSKQQSCPYCRKDFSRAATVLLYQEVASEIGRELRGAELASYLLRPTMNVTMETLEVMDIEDANL